MRAAVLGAGNWGTTVALLLHANGHSVSVWEFNERLAQEMLEFRENRTYLKGFHLPGDILITSSLAEAVEDRELVIFVVPSSVMRTTARNVWASGALRSDAVLVSLSKGLEHDTLKTMTDVIAGEIGPHPLIASSAEKSGRGVRSDAGLASPAAGMGEEGSGVMSASHRIVALSGPCIASEVACGLPTTIVSASTDHEAACVVQDAFMTSRFRVYTSEDPLGVQLGGALKNIIAIAAGINDGLGFGTNAKSALITRG
ncbi:MAG: NAD(P)H-dependent glycerol-3-phosphate dehydrogenase, partial [Candidatus Latescibacterota bacterium]